MGLQDTPHSQRLTIGFFGKPTAESLHSQSDHRTGNISCIPAAGTTTDPVYKAMEIKAYRCSSLTLGFDDTSYLGEAYGKRST